MSDDDTENGSDDMTSEPEPAPSGGGSDDMLEDMFDLAGNKTDMNTELMAGLTTFLATAYIIFVNPQILGEAFANYGQKMDHLRRLGNIRASRMHPLILFADFTFNPSSGL